MPNCKQPTIHPQVAAKRQASLQLQIFVSMKENVYKGFWNWNIMAYVDHLWFNHFYMSHYYREQQDELYCSIFQCEELQELATGDL